MKIYDKRVRVSLSLVATFLLVILIVVSLYIFWRAGDDGGKLAGLTGSLASGLIIAIIQFWLGWLDFAQTKELKKMELLEILYNRDSRDKYESYIKKSKRKIDIMGVTSVRFFNHFADTDTSAPEGAKVLLHAMERNVNVRVLLPSDEFLPNETKRQDAYRVRIQYFELKKKYPHNIEIRYFNHIAAHSIFRIDDTCIIGPVFPKLESKYTPALHVMNSSPIALNYMDYFESEWNLAIKNHA